MGTVSSNRTIFLQATVFYESVGRRDKVYMAAFGCLATLITSFGLTSDLGKRLLAFDITAASMEGAHRMQVGSMPKSSPRLNDAQIAGLTMKGMLARTIVMPICAPAVQPFYCIFPASTTPHSKSFQGHQASPRSSAVPSRM